MPVKVVSFDPVPVYEAPAYDQPPRNVVITNTDKTNPVYYSDSPGTVNKRSAFIEPLGAEVFDGLDDVWLTTLDQSVSVTVQLKIGSSNYAPGQVAIQGNVQATVSGNVNITNTPNVNVSSGSVTVTAGTVNVVSLTAKNVLVAQTSFNLAAGASSAVFTGSPSQPSYEIIIQANLTATGTPQRTQQVTLTWKDSASGLITAVETYYFSAPNPSPTIVVGAGPTKGDTLTVQLTNNDTAICAYQFTVLQHSRSYVRDRWYSEAMGGSYAGQPAATSDPSAALLADMKPSLAANTGASVLLPLWSGRAFIHAQSGNAWFAIIKTINPIAANSGQVWSFTGTAAQVIDQEIILPRSQCTLQVNNTGSTTANVQATITADM